MKTCTIHIEYRKNENIFIFQIITKIALLNIENNIYKKGSIKNLTTIMQKVRTQDMYETGFEWTHGF